MKTKTTNSKLDDLFVEWKQSFIAKKEPTVNENNVEKPLFTEDGIMRKKDFLTNKAIPEDVLDRMWKSSRRIVFFLKEQNQRVETSKRWPEDIRDWAIIWEKGYRLDKFFRRIGLLLYGLSHVSKDKSIKQSDIESQKKEKIIEAYRDIPFAFVEAKKVPGGKQAYDPEIKRYLIRYCDFVKKEIDLLNPGIIVCCGNPQYDFMMNIYFPTNYKWTFASETLHYDATTDMIIIKINHPSARNIKKDFEYYEKAMEPVIRLLADIPEALNTP